ncbi:AGE family epimerase/isomerase [Brevundimonas intermedia]|nr:AGE family epimerase/isomerase [Brevundimonas intermedia]
MSLPEHGLVSHSSEGFDEELLADAAALTTWLRQAALPVWCTLGLNAVGAFEERLGQDGRRLVEPRRARVQARQLYVFAEAGRCGWNGPWRPAIEMGLKRLNEVFLRSDGLMRTRVAYGGETLDETAYLYDQAFYLLALASISRAYGSTIFERDAVALRDGLCEAADIQGGMREAGAHPYQSNAHMHLLEASLAWEEAGRDPGWRLMSDQIVRLAQTRFIDRQGGYIREFFEADWSPADGLDGRLVEPGHQFEWAWLLARYGQARADQNVIDDARRIYAAGLKGVDPSRRVAVDEMNDDGSLRLSRARLWPQTEWLKASMFFASHCDSHHQNEFISQASLALRALLSYLMEHGVWRDKMFESKSFLDEPAPASSLYHIVASYIQTRDTLRGLLKRPLPAVELA